ncbi:VOC family protein [Fodinicola feengrottensis]|uniref:VOC family protein n=1 Tax=Fodinicola feengrottensis TaxID=435914 RepID=A0ABN2IS00_9ACTN
MNSAIRVLGVDNILFAVANLDDAIEFYADRLGLPLVFRLDEPGIALFKLGPEAPGLLLRRGTVASPAPSTAARLWLEVPDAREAAETLRTRGVEPLSDPFSVATGWIVEVADAAGNIIGFTDYTANPSLGRTAGH